MGNDGIMNSDEKLQAILSDRGQQYGDFEEMSECIQALKDLMRNQPGWPRLAAFQREALEMTCTKIGRILTGNPDNLDSWMDIAGYTQKAAEMIERKRP